MGLRPVHVTSAELGSDARRGGGHGRALLPPGPIFRDTFIYDEEYVVVGRMMAVGSEVARRGIETYLLAQLAPVQRQYPPLTSRRNFGRPRVGEPTSARRDTHFSNLFSSL